MRLLVPAVALLCALPACAQSAQVPVRSLLAEKQQLELGSAAYIHTQFATGTGLLLRGDVVTARHNVLTPDGRIAPEIGVGVPEPPLNNITETRSVAIAQDPVHDLVLLHITGEAALPTPAAREDALSAESEPAPVAYVAAAPCKSDPIDPIKPTIRPARSSPRARHPRARKPAAVHLQSAALTRTRANTPAPVRLHIVWDGPATASRTGSR